MKFTLAATLLPATLLTGFASAQANDECTGALPALLGTTNFDNTGATTSTPPFTCEPTFGQADIWYTFTPPTTSLYTFDTCGASFDTVLEIFEGDCATGVVVGCNDDSCGVQSSVALILTGGVDYQVRIGGWNGSMGFGALEISDLPLLPLELAAHYRLDEPSGIIAADSSGNGAPGTYSFVTQGAPGAHPNTGLSARFDGATATVDIAATPILDALRRDLSVAAWVNVDAAIPSTYRIWSNSGPAGSWSFAITPNGLAFTTHAVKDYSAPATITPNAWHHVAAVMNRVNDISFYLDGVLLGVDTGGEDSRTPSSEYHIGAWNPNFSIPQFYAGRIDDVQLYSGQLSASDVANLFANPGTTAGTNSIGTSYCGPGVPNSTGASSDLSAEGTVSVALNDVTLIASDLPQNSFGFFLVSSTQGFTTNPGGSAGNLCLSGAIGRYVGPGQILNAGSAGGFSLAIDLAAIPSPNGFISAMPGDVFNFQTWHRDAVGGSATSNFTNGVEIMFQ